MKKMIAITLISLSVFLISCGSSASADLPSTNETEAADLNTEEKDSDTIVIDPVNTKEAADSPNETGPEKSTASPETDIETKSETEPGKEPEMASETTTEIATEITTETATDTETETPPETETEPEAAPETASGAVFTKSTLDDGIKQRITGLSYGADCTIPYDDLRYLVVTYVDFSGQDRTGELICNKAIADDLLDIFKNLYNERYEIDKIRLVDEYGADDDLSCADDNTSCFNYRTVAGSSSLSKHALGRAIDINPFYNPYVTYPNGKERISPPGSEPYADRSADFPHKIDKNDAAYREFKAHGFTWGGDWKTLKDYQHFQK